MTQMQCKYDLTAQKMKFSIKDFFSKSDQIRNFLKKFVMENLNFCAVSFFSSAYDQRSLTH